MQIPCNSYKAIASATQIRSKIEIYLKNINGGKLPVGPLGPQIEDAYVRGLIDEDRKNNLEKILVEYETILFNVRDGTPLEFNDVKEWAKYVDSLD